jgi:hypothetical protein
MAASRRVMGLWVYQTLDHGPPKLTAVAALAVRPGLTRLNAQAFAGNKDA